jgi:hypothetical protein
MQYLYKISLNLQKVDPWVISNGRVAWRIRHLFCIYLIFIIFYVRIRVLGRDSV